jgi:pimeloyl-ACP methyl ester carboxylesterase
MYRVGPLHSGNLSRLAARLALLLSLVTPTKSQIPNQSKPIPPGRLVNVGGYRVHLYCTGQGSPTVMIVGAAFSFDWGLVQPEVAKFSRVCTFDPSGTAWSDAFPVAVGASSSIAMNPVSAPSSTPTCSDRVDEIHRLITMASIDGPYVFVGLSVGALWERLYVAQYPENDIVGIVIVDHAFLGGVDDGTRKDTSALSNAHGGDYVPPKLISTVPITLDFEDNVNFARLPARNQSFHRWALSQHPIRVDAKLVADCQTEVKRATSKRAYPLGDLPLIVISTPNDTPGYSALQDNLLGLSPRSEHVIAWNSTHMVPIDRPDVIIKAIHELVESARKHGLKSKIP